MRKPVSAVLFLAGELEDTHIEVEGLDKEAIQAKLKEVKSAYGTKHGEQEHSRLAPAGCVGPHGRCLNRIGLLPGGCLAPPGTRMTDKHTTPVDQHTTPGTSRPE